MNAEKVKQVISWYLEEGALKNTTPKECLSDLVLYPADIENRGSILRHCAYELEEALKHIENGEVVKAFGRLMFAQGCMLIVGKIYSKSQLDKHIAPIFE